MKNEDQNKDSQIPEEDIVLEKDEEMTDRLNPESKQLRAKLKASITEAKENLAGWQRSKADYINLKNEFQRKQVDLFQLASERVIGDLLPALDSFTMAFADRIAWEKTPVNWRVGIENIHNQLLAILADHGVSRLDVLGKDFDPTRHESVGFINTDQASDDHKVLAVVKDGYELNGKIIRPAQVKIGQINQQ